MSCFGVYPTRMAWVAGGQPPPAFNDVYLAHVWRVKEGMVLSWVCVNEWQMFSMREERNQADISPDMSGITTQRSSIEGIWLVVCAVWVFKWHVVIVVLLSWWLLKHVCLFKQRQICEGIKGWASTRINVSVSWARKRETTLEIIRGTA